MTVQIRPAAVSDLHQMTDLLIQDAAQRHATNPALWPLSENEQQRVANAVRKSLDAKETSSFEEFWLLAQDSGRTVGLSHAMMLPIPPIYAGKSGLPGLILDDCFTVEEAPLEAEAALLLATEAALRRSGAALLLASCLVESPRMLLLEQHGYKPITLYMGKTGFVAEPTNDTVRLANRDDIPGIVAASARHRAALSHISACFWNIHPEADERFGNWMQHSLTLTDRDMFVDEAQGQVQGYIIAQPIAPLLVPAAHDISGIGVIDDFYHADFADIATVTHAGRGATHLLQAAENAFAARQVNATFVVCPAGWPAKISVLAQHGYQPAKVWLLKAP